jgi:hypothetical protein
MEILTFIVLDEGRSISFMFDTLTNIILSKIQIYLEFNGPEYKNIIIKEMNALILYDSTFNLETIRGKVPPYLN